MSIRRAILVLGLWGCSSDGGTPPGIVFHGEDQPFSGFMADTGLQPPGSPVQIQFKVGAMGKITAEAHATSGGPDGAPVVAAVAGSGALAVEGGFDLAARLKVDVSGVPKYDGDVPGLDSIDLAFHGSAMFDPFLVGKSVTATADVPMTKLPPIPLPGGLPGDLLLTIDTGSTVTVTFEGTCAASSGGMAQYQGQTTTSGTLKIKPTVELKVPIVGTKSFDLPEQSVPIPPIARGLDLGTQKVSGGGSAPTGDVMKQGTCAPVVQDGGPAGDGGLVGDGGRRDGGGGGDGGPGDGGGGSGGDGGMCAGPPRIPDPDSIVWRPPLGPTLGHCDAQQIATYASLCVNASTASVSGCEATFGPAGFTTDRVCAACLTTDASQPAYGPLVRTSLATAFNRAGCIAVSDPAQLSCAKAVQAAEQCAILACEPPICAATSNATQCLNAAATSVCSGYPTTCASSLAAPVQNACLSFASLDQAFIALAKKICCGLPANATCGGNKDCCSGTCTMGKCQ